MSAYEFELWRDVIYPSAPWGIEVEDRRHTQALNGMVNVARSNGSKMEPYEFDTIRIGNIDDNIRRIRERMMIAPALNSTPWVDDDYSAQVTQGQNLLAMFSKQTRIPIKE